MAMGSLVAAAASMAVLLVACGPTPSSLASEAEASLHLPGSTEVATGGYDAEKSVYGSLSAVAWRQYGADVPWEDVLAYFDAELARRGWEPGGGSSGLTSTDEYVVEAWHKSDRILRLGYMRNGPPGANFGTFYDVALIGSGLKYVPPTPVGASMTLTTYRGHPGV
jgi:hypothetical protein